LVNEPPRAAEPTLGTVTSGSDGIRFGWRSGFPYSLGKPNTDRREPDDKRGYDGPLGATRVNRRHPARNVGPSRNGRDNVQDQRQEARETPQEAEGAPSASPSRVAPCVGREQHRRDPADAEGDESADRVKGQRVDFVPDCHPDRAEGDDRHKDDGEPAEQSTREVGQRPMRPTKIRKDIRIREVENTHHKAVPGAK